MTGRAKAIVVATSTNTELGHIATYVKEAKEELNSDDNDRIVAATEKLSNETQNIFAKVYQQAGANAQGAQGSAADDNGETEFHQN